MDKKGLFIRLDEETKEKLKAKAEDNCDTMTSYVQRLIKKDLKEGEE